MENRRKYRFLFVSAPFGGIEVVSKNLQKIVEKTDDIEATWMWIDFHPDDLIAKIPPISMNWTLKGGLIAKTRLSGLLRDRRTFDAAFFNHTIPLMFLQKFRKKVPVTLSLDITPELLRPYSQWYRGKSSDAKSFGAGIKHVMTRNIYEDAASILPWSRLVKGSLQKDYGINETKIEVVPPGIDLQQWRSPNGNRAKGPQDPVHILFVGGDFLRKGGDLLLRIAAREEFRHCQFHFVTRSFQGVQGPNVRVYANEKANSDSLLKLYRDADIFALPTRADLSPAAVCEAMAFRLPVVTTKVGGLDEIVMDDTNGYIVPADDEQAFAARLLELASSDERRRQFGINGRTLVEERYDITKNAGVIIDVMKRSVRTP